MRKRLALVLGVFVTLIVSGCGQQATSSGSATKLTVEEGTFKFALSGMAKPYNYTDKDGKLAPDFEDEILKAALVTRDGVIVHEQLKTAPAAAKPAASAKAPTAK